MPMHSWIRSLFTRPTTRTNHQATRRVRVRVEELEPRTVPTAGLTPMQVRAAYGFDQLAFSVTHKSSIAADGKGETIAIVDAYDNAQIFSDLDTFDNKFGVNGKQSLYKQYGAASSVLTKATPQGVVPPPAGSTWPWEIDLDVEWAHAVAPAAQILLVEAASNNWSDLLNAVDYARNQPGVVAVSMSWGSGEFSDETGLDSYFTTPAGHAGITFVAASGDNVRAIYPALSPNVVGVGGTTLTVDSSGNYRGETAWSKSGGGYSAYESLPNYQVGTVSGTQRGSPDVAYDADLKTGFSVFYNGAWNVVGGTSAGAPQWAALIAIADQGRALNSQGSLDGASQTLPALYALPGSDFHVIASTGWDTQTGRGSPVANLMIPDLVNVAAAGAMSVNAASHPSRGAKANAAVEPDSEGLVSLGGASGSATGAGGTTASVTWVNGGGQAATVQPGDVVQIPSPDPATQRAVQGPNSQSVQSPRATTLRDPGNDGVDEVGDAQGGHSGTARGVDGLFERSVQSDGWKGEEEWF
jgi:hypothetical protein